MQTTTIDVSFVNPPKPGKKLGSLKTRDNETYWVYANDISRFEPGSSYDVQYEESKSDDGQMVFKTIKFPKSGPGAPRAAASERIEARHPAKGGQSREMAAMGLVARRWQGSWMEPLDPVALQQEYEIVLQAWDKANAPKPQRAALDDAIPF